MRPARGRGSRGPVVTSWRMETGLLSAAVTACLSPYSKRFGNRPKYPLTGGNLPGKRLEQPKLVDLGALPIDLCRRHLGCCLRRLGRRLRRLRGLRLLGSAEREQLGQPREVLAQRLEHAWRVERGGGMEDRVEPHRAPARTTGGVNARQARDPGRVAAEKLRREVAERADHRRLDQLDLAVEILLAVVDLDRQRVAVAGWMTLEDIRDKHLRARQPDLPEQLFQQFARAADERHSLLVLACTGPLADDH